MYFQIRSHYTGTRGLNVNITFGQLFKTQQSPFLDILLTTGKNEPGSGGVEEEN